MKTLKLVMVAAAVAMSIALVGCGALPTAEQIETGAAVFAHAQKVACPAVAIAVAPVTQPDAVSSNPLADCKAPQLAQALALPSGMFLPKQEVDALNGYLGCLQARAAEGRGQAQGAADGD